MKLTVRVPHLIKHVHYNHLKPVHIHTTESKKVDHHYVADEEWEFSHKGLREDFKERGSFSNLKPITWHQNPHFTDLNTQDINRSLKKYYKKGLGDLSNSNHQQFHMSKTNEDDQTELASTNVQSRLVGNIGQTHSNNDEWLRSERGSPEAKKTHGFSRGFRQGKSKNMNNKAINTGENDWTPVINAEGWKDFSGDENKYKINNSDQLFDLKEHRIQENVGVNDNFNKYPAELRDIGSKVIKRNKHKKDNTKGAWNKKILQDHKKGNTFLPHANQGQETHKILQPFLGEDLQSFDKLNMPEYVKDYRLKHTDSSNSYTTEPQTNQYHAQNHYLKSQRMLQQQTNIKLDPEQIYKQEWQNQKQNLQPNLYPNTNKLQHHQQNIYQHIQPQQHIPLNINHQPHQHQQNIHQEINQYRQNNQHETTQHQNHQRTNKAPRQQQQHHSTVAEASYTSHSPQPILSQHELQTPQHSMWPVQQQSTLLTTAQGHSISHKPDSLLKTVLSPPVLLHSKSQDVPNPVQQNNEEYDVNNQHRKVKQQWHQSVQTSSKDGPTSSYKVEVINYSPIKKVTSH